MKDLRALPKDVKGRAALSILELTATSLPQGGEAEGLQGMYRRRVGDYRIVYEVAGDEVIIIAFSHRKDIYRDLE